MAKGEIKPFWATKQHDLRKLWILFDKFVIYINYFAPFPHVPITILLNVLITKAWPWRVYRGFINIAWPAHGLVSCWTWIWLRNGYSGQHVDTLITFSWTKFQWTKLSPAHPPISFSIFENILHKITQCLYSKAILSICASDDDWRHSLKMIVNY